MSQVRGAGADWSGGPGRTAADQRHRGPSDANHHCGPPMRLLVVEDDADTSRVLRHALTSEQHVVEVADKGAEGLWMATEFDFDVVILDWTLPDLSGIEIC